MRAVPDIMAIIAVFTSVANARSSYQKQDHDPDASWEFSLYQNSHCTGEVSLFSGSNSTTCQDAIYNGGALAYIPNNITDPNCKVHFFGDDHCAQNDTVRTVGAQAASTCTPVKAKGEEDIRSFLVKC
ncbi:hypothetical protein BDV59DRAFT_126573 [Aspergillus ambiguus]|uniref:uncharacterized protein n=1 Tax=Aspergillus ambiguus TaxID=176160 RepID=UPI003CCD659C